MLITSLQGSDRNRLRDTEVGLKHLPILYWPRSQAVLGKAGQHICLYKNLNSLVGVLSSVITELVEDLKLSQDGNYRFASA